MKNRIIFLLTLLPLYFNGEACTVISCAMKGEVLAGANEDYDNPFIKMWFNPATPDRYGSVCFGFPDFQAQAAMNEHGLFFDFTAQEGIDPSKLKLKNPWYGDLFFEILGKCKTVTEALAFLENHSYAFRSQVMLADREGRSVIINAQAIVEKTGPYQINTNFNVCNLKDRNYNCWRYDLADKELSSATEISVPYFRKLLKMTHQKGNGGTLYSNIYDLKRGMIYVNLFRNFDDVYVIDLKKELQKGYRVENLADHFPTLDTFESLVKNHPEFNREQILVEIEQQGVDKTLSRYQEMQLQEKDSARRAVIDGWLTDAALVLIKKSYNECSHGGSWHYWYNFPTSYDIWPSFNKDLTDATTILKRLLDQHVQHPPAFFIQEMYAYANLMQGNKEVAREYYKKSSADAPQESGNYKRSIIMLQKYQ